MFMLCAEAAWGETFTINCNTSSSDELFSVSGNGTQYDYDSRWTSYNLIKMDKGESITITNVTGATITAISAQGVADDNGNKTVNFTISDGTTSAQTSSSSWNNRKTATSLTSRDFNATNVGKLKHGEGQTYTITNNTSSSYNAGVRFVITYTPAPSKTAVYLKPNANWLQKDDSSVDPRFAVYYFKSSNSGDDGWISMTMEESCSPVYKASIPEGYDQCIFCRMNGADADNKWDNRYNQTGDLTVPTGKAFYYAVPDEWWDTSGDAFWQQKPFGICLSGTWLRFKGETITLTATCAGAKYFQWYKGDNIVLSGQTSSTLTIENCDYTDAGNYYCKAWNVTGDENEAWSGTFGVKVPRLVIQTPGSGSDRQDIAFTRTNTSAEAATCEVYLGAAWEYEFVVDEGFSTHGNSGTMNSDNCTGWTMDKENSNWCRIQTTKEGTYHFNLTFSNSNYTPLVMSVGYPPMAQDGGWNVYIENTPAMQARGWNNNSIYYRIGKGKYDDEDTRNWTDAQLMTLVPGTARYLVTTTPDWDNDFWVWHIGNNAGRAAGNYSIYKTNTGDSYAITESSNFHGDAITSDRTIYLNSTSGGPGMDPMNSNCQFYGYTYSNGMLVHNASVSATTNGKIKVEYTHHDGSAQASEGYDARTLNDLAHTCILTITAVPDNGFYCTSLQVNGEDFTSGSTHILDANATITATFELVPVPSVTYILGSCYVKNGMWTQGSDGNVKAWLYQEGATPAQNNLKETTDISYSSTSTGGIYFNTKDLTLLDTESQWGTSQGGNRAIKALKVGSGSTLKFNLRGMIANKIYFYVFPNTNNAYSIDLTVNGVTTNQPIAASGKDKWHKFSYMSGNFSGEFSIKSYNSETRVVVIVEVPLVTVTFDKNDGSGTTTTQKLPKGAEGELDENPFTWADHKFIGWTEDPAGTGEIIYDNDVYSSETDVTLYAKWEEIIKTTITLDATGAYNGYTGSVVATYGEPMPEIAALPERVGYVFEGYYDQPNGAGTQYYTGLGTGVRNWDKTTATETLYAMWLTPCDLVPTLSTPAPITTIWDQKKVDLGVVRLTCDFDTTGVEYVLQSVSPTDPINGCHFEYFDEQVHLMGTPNVGNTTTQEVTVTFTLANNCSPASTYTITQTIRIYPASQKPKIAFILTGTKDGGFDAYSTTDRTACSSLIDYLDDFYDVTCVNGYSTKNTTAIENYYKDYDLLIVTDFLNTKEGYTNAIGSLIDKKPILSFEAYVANLSNWHIGSNPKDPNPPVGTMKVLCAGHAIFGDAEGVTVFNKPGGQSDTTITVLSSLSEKGLQGFTINEAPDFIFLATVRDTANNRDLVVCCERQIVFPARLLIYGINHNEMGNLSPAGRVVMHQMIDYLLMTDETSIADCSLVFDNAAGDHKWSNPANWSPGRNIIPTPYHPTRIIAECWVDTDDAHAGSVKVNTNRAGQPVIDGKLIVKPYGGLTVAGMVQKVHDTRYATPIVIKAEDLLIEADATKNGAFVYGNKESDVRATVQYYSRGTDALTANPVWQYMGIPFQAGQTAISMYHAAWMCRWSSASDHSIGGLWEWVANEDVLVPFEGYCITQESTKTYTFQGKLNAPVTKTLMLDNHDGDGYAFAANSWTAPIKIQEMQDEDFTNAEKAIYIYHSGTYVNAAANPDPVDAHSGAAATMPGQYAVVPIHSSPYLTGADSVIPAMQGFFIKTDPAKQATLKLVYNRVVYDATYFKTSTQPMRAPSRYGAPDVMRLSVTGETFGGDCVHLLARGDFSEEFEDGWDGRKLEGDANVPQLAVLKEAGEMTVAAIPTAEERYLSFRAGNDLTYTFHFDYEGDLIYLYDIETGIATEIQTGNTYTFVAANKTPMNRFLITKNPPRTPTDLEEVNEETVNGVAKFIHEGKLLILYRGAIYDALGKRVDMRKEGAQ